MSDEHQPYSVTKHPEVLTPGRIDIAVDLPVSVDCRRGLRLDGDLDGFRELYRQIGAAIAEAEHDG